MGLAHNVAEPLYQQIRDLLLEEIRAGRYGVHQRLPSERELSVDHGVSRMTVRQALIDLQQRGAVYSRVGRGTFVAPPKVDQELRVVTSFTHDMIARGARASSQVLEAGLTVPSSEVATGLELSPGDQVVRLARLRLADDVPMALETAYLPARLVPGLLDHDFARESLYEVLAHDYHLILIAASQTIEAALADEDELRLLHMKAPAPVLHMRRLTHSDEGRPIEVVISTYRGDRYQLHSKLEPGAGRR